MILLDRYDTIITVALSTHDMEVAPTTMEVKNLQSKEVTTFPIYDIAVSERTGIYQFYVIRDGSIPPPAQPDITLLKLPDGTYTYKCGEEIGLFQVGIPALDKVEYSTQGQNVVYQPS